MNKPHQKHDKIARPALGVWGRTELSLHGATCETFAGFKNTLVAALTDFRLGWIDASHAAADTQTGPEAIAFELRPGGSDLRLPGQLDPFLRHLALCDADLVLVNGNHFTSPDQILFITADKPMETRLDRLQNVRLVIVPDLQASVP